FSRKKYSCGVKALAESKREVGAEEFKSTFNPAGLDSVKGLMIKNRAAPKRRGGRSLAGNIGSENPLRTRGWEYRHRR
ncbi:MAG: hypothetical protein Q8O90_10845, partial [Elusimicrobiota bacterium]|nr:hypothetical protein [Elusimicrobiota bacterium]